MEISKLMSTEQRGSGGVNGKSAIDDPLSPYFLHHSDSPGMILVSQLLNGDNYSSWSRSMSIALSVKNKLGFVDGTIVKPSGTDLLLLNSWVRNNNIVISWILNSVSKEISASTLFSDSAVEIWNDLRERFQQSNGPRIFQLRRELVNLRQDQHSVAVYFTKLKSLWEELCNFRPNCSCGKCTCGGVKDLNAFQQTEYAMTFLMGLNESFTHSRGQILLMDPIPPINKVFALMAQEEKQRTIGVSAADSSNALAMATKVDSRVGNKLQKTKDRPVCSHCKMLGHTIDKCYKLHGYPPGYKSKIKGQANVANAQASEDQQVDAHSQE